MSAIFTVRNFVILFLCTSFFEFFYIVLFYCYFYCFFFFFSSRRRHTRYWRDWSSDVCSSDLAKARPSEAVFSVVLAPRWVSLCFLQGAKLPDPERLLRGGGKQVRNIRLEDRKSVV